MLVTLRDQKVTEWSLVKRVRNQITYLIAQITLLN